MAVTGAGLLRLAEVMDRLRSPGGCPWDAEQTHESLVQYLVEETFETVDAIDSGDREHLLEELGDLLLQVYFHARIAEESETPFNIDDVANGISDKLIRRHPHVFPDADGAVIPVADAATVEARWQELKNKEKGRKSVMAGVPVSLPALTQVDKLFQRLANAGLALPDSPATEHVRAAMTQGVSPAELMVAAVRQMRTDGLDPDGELRSQVVGLRAAIAAIEAESGRD